LKDSRIPGLYRCSIHERIAELERRGYLSAADAAALHDGRHVLSAAGSDQMVENVVATFGLPLAIAANFQINGRDVVVPLVIEEPSVVAALSNAARLARGGGGFTSTCNESQLIGQIHVSGVKDVVVATDAILSAKERLLAIANEYNPKLQSRGGGVCDLQVRSLQLESGDKVLVVHLLVDTCDAMGANIVNSLCEFMAPQVAALCDGKPGMSILSNLVDRSLVTARVRYRLPDLDPSGGNAVYIRDAIVLANEIACADPYRAATHNKGIMNGIDPLAIATGNDWRAIEAGVHAYAAADGQYRALTNWSVGDAGELLGELRLPIKVGIVGGTSASNPAVAVALRICGVESARELAELMAAVGLAQNFSALRALVSSGIQKGHMRLQARSVAAAAGVPQDLLEDVAAEMANSGTVRASNARALLAEKLSGQVVPTSDCGFASGKVILLGEHAVVYGKHALALPIENAVSATVTITADTTLCITDWGVRHSLDLGSDKLSGMDAAIALIVARLELPTKGFSVTVRSQLPRAMGLGSSAAIVVAIVRAFSRRFELNISDEQVNELAYDCEKLAHGTPSGVDNAVATYGMPLLFRRDGEVETTRLTLPETVPLLIACSNSRGLTIEQVAAVRARRAKNKRHYDALFDEIDALSIQGATALQNGEFDELGGLMNVCHGLLNAIEVSTTELERMVEIARDGGAVGAKLTGAGGGGSIVALCPGRLQEVAKELRRAGFKTMPIGIGE
jgi:hydroxymethylglutaryl-CoA reductase